jgi:hypothetical protein
MDESDWQNEKHENPIASIFRGILIDRRNEDENAEDSIRFNYEFDSNEMDDSDRHPEKKDHSRISTFRGFPID